MQRDNVSGEPVNEKFLFHGTSKNAVDAICANNFDWRLCGSHGTVYGQGSYTVTLLTSHGCCSILDLLQLFSKPDLCGKVPMALFWHICKSM